MTIKNKKLITLLVILEIVAITAIFELGVRIYAAFIVKRPKIHRPDSVCGWRTLPNLNMQRLDPDGRPWQLITDERGVRGPSSWTSDNRKRILILGDCFVLGDGVNLLKRFDRRIAALEPTWDIIALGGLGYGTDQELLLGKEYFGLLRSGDICIFNTYINDFSDILRKSFEGRAKPWFTLSGGILTEHPPVIGAKEILREKSYIFSKIVELFEKDERKFSTTDFAESPNLYYRILTIETKDLRDRGVKVVVTLFGADSLDKERRALLNAMFNKLAQEKNMYYFPLDEALKNHGRDNNYFRGRSLWTEKGHETAAIALHSYLSQMK